MPALAIGVAGGGLGLETNQFGFSLTGVAGQTVVIQASTDLTTWTPLATNRLDGGALCFSDAACTTYIQRFYRVGQLIRCQEWNRLPAMPAIDGKVRPVNGHDLAVLRLLAHVSKR